MITKAQAVAATHRQEFYHGTLRNADGTPKRARVNGACRTWRTRPNDFMLPMKTGLKQCFYIDQGSADMWHATEAEALGKQPPTAYRAIAAWGKALGSFAYYIASEQRAASAAGAPLDALFADGEGKWKCVSDLAADHPFRLSFESQVAA